MTTLFILNAATNQEKLSKITATVHKHFILKERMLIAVPSIEVADYLNLLLWRLPAESFLPHVIAEKACQEPIVITTSTNNHNKAKVLLNLLPVPHSGYTEYALIYEILDATDSAKQAMSQKKIQHYQMQGIAIAPVPKSEPL